LLAFGEMGPDLFSGIRHDPGRSARTGTEVMKKEGTIVINRDWCKGCGICVAFCPGEALVLDDKEKACWAFPDRCKRCGICEMRCPDIAIELVEK